MNTRRRFGLIAKQMIFATALLVGCGSSDSARQKLVREAKGPAQMPSWEATEQSEARTADIQPDTHMAAGRLHESQGRLTRAVAQYRMAVQLSPGSVEPHSRLGLVLCQMRQFEEADAEFAKAIALAPKQAQLYNNLGFSYLMQSRWPEAEAQFSKALALNPAFARAHVNLGMVLAQQERFDQAMRHFQTVVPPEDAWFNIGLMYQSKSRPNEAARAFKTALKLNPNLVAAKRCLEKLPPEVSGAAVPFESVTALASSVEPQTQPAAEPTSPVEGIATADQPSTEGQTTPEQNAHESIRTVESPEVMTTRPAESTQESLELAEAPGFQAMPVEESTALDAPDAEMDEEAEYGEGDEYGQEGEYGEEDEYGQDDESESDPSSMDEDETAEVRSIDSKTLAVLMNTGLSDSQTTAGTLDASTQPENEGSLPTAETYMADRTGPTAEPTPISTSQPSMASRSLFTANNTPSEPDDDTFEIVLSSRPPLPPGAINTVLSATQPSSDEPTPQELRTVIDALLELSRPQDSSMPKPYSLPTTQPTAGTPQSQPAGARSDAGERLSLGEFADDWDCWDWSEFESVFSPGGSLDSTDLEP